MRWPEPGDKYYDVVLSKNYQGDVVQTEARLEDRGGSQFYISVEERATRPDIFTASYTFSSRKTLVNPMKDKNFSQYTYANIAEIMETSNRCFAQSSPLKVVLDKTYPDSDIDYKNITSFSTRPLVTEEINLPLPYSAFVEFTPLEPTVFALRSA